MENGLQQLARGISDVEMVAESEAYQAALVFYAAVKAAVAQDVPGAEIVHQALKAIYITPSHLLTALKDL